MPFKRIFIFKKGRLSHEELADMLKTIQAEYQPQKL